MDEGIRVRVAPELVDEAREHAGLPPDTPLSQVVRYALAVIAGKEDPQAVAARPYGAPSPMEQPDIQAARRAYIASLAPGQRRYSRERLARDFDIYEYWARRIIAEVDAKGGAAA